MEDEQSTTPIKELRSEEMRRIKALVNESYEIKTIFESDNGKDKGDVYVYRKLIDNGIWDKNGIQRLNKMVYQQKNFNTISTIDGYLKELKMVNIDHDAQFNEKDNVRIFRNCALDMISGEQMDKSSTLMKTNMLNVLYKPSLDYLKALTYIQQIVDKDDVNTLVEWIGYTLLNGYRYKKMLFLIGKADSGKSTFSNILKNFLGEFNVSNVNLNLISKDPRYIGGLMDKMMNITSELSDSFLSETSWIKSLTGDDTLQVDKKYAADNISFTNEAKMLCHGNGVPRLRGTETEKAFHERVMIVDFPHAFKQTDDNSLIKYMMSENGKSELLNLAIYGIKRLLENDGFTEKYDTLSKKIAKYSSISNPIKMFLNKWTVYDQEEWVEKNNLYGMYKDWCTLEGVEPQRAQEFKKLVGRDKQIRASTKVINGNKKYTFKGISLIIPEIDEEAFL